MTAVRPLVVGLDDPSTTEVAVGGAKAAGLARARAAGLPVLEGFVVSPAASVGAISAGRELLEPAGSGGARMAVIRSQLDPSLLADIASAAAGLPQPVIVRSSSVLEGEGEWSGAFTSVPEVSHDEIPKAIRSVWATSFALDVLDRFRAEDLEPGCVPMGVLVQPEIAPDFGGVAMVDARGAVTVTAVKGSPRDLLAGWVSGARAVYEQQALVGQEVVDLMGPTLPQQVVDLALRVQDELRHNLIEWAVHEGRVVLLQIQDAAVNEVRDPVAIPAALAHPDALHLARLTHRYPGALGEDLILGWLPGMRDAVEARPAGVGADLDDLGDPGDPGVGGDDQRLLAAAGQLAAQLTAQAWGEPPAQAMAHARLVLRRLRSDRPDESIDALRTLRPVDPEAAARLLSMYEALADDDTTAAQRRGTDRWEPLLAGVAALQGEVVTGQGSVGGIGAGRLVWVESPHRTGHVRPRDIVVTQYPLPNFSPLLWDAAGVITLGGAPSAHLFEVARSLTVPAVVDCPIGDIVRDASGPVLGMLDGDAGRVAVLR